MQFPNNIVSLFKRFGRQLFQFRRSKHEKVSHHFMRIALLIISILTFGCTGHIKLSKAIPNNYESYNIFFCKSWGSNKFYGATNPHQIKMLTTGLKIKIWKGYWDGAEEEGLLVTKNNYLYKQAYYNIIIKSNIVEFKDSLPTFTKNSRFCDKITLIQLLDSLKKLAIPYYIDRDTSMFYGDQFFKINYNIGTNKFPSKKEHSSVNKTNDSIVNNFKVYFPDRKTWISNYKNSRDGNIELNIAVTSSGPNEIRKFDRDIYSKIKSVKNVTIDTFAPKQYYINYFLKDKNGG